MAEAAPSPRAWCRPVSPTAPCVQAAVREAQDALTHAARVAYHVSDLLDAMHACYRQLWNIFSCTTDDDAVGRTQRTLRVTTLQLLHTFCVPHAEARLCMLCVAIVRAPPLADMLRVHGDTLLHAAIRHDAPKAVHFFARIRRRQADALTPLQCAFTCMGHGAVETLRSMLACTQPKATEWYLRPAMDGLVLLAGAVRQASPAFLDMLLEYIAAHDDAAQAARSARTLPRALLAALHDGHDGVLCRAADACARHAVPLRSREVACAFRAAAERRLPATLAALASAHPEFLASRTVVAARCRAILAAPHAPSAGTGPRTAPAGLLHADAVGSDGKSSDDDTVTLDRAEGALEAGPLMVPVPVPALESSTPSSLPLPSPQMFTQTTAPCDTTVATPVPATRRSSRLAARPRLSYAGM